MNEMTKTLAFAGVASALLATVALATWLPELGRGPGEGFDEQGDPFFPGFAARLDEDPLAARVLEVVEYDEDTATLSPFRVEFRDGEWTIPSHHGYAADAEDRIASLSAQVAGLTKDSIRSDLVRDHEELGVVDPEDRDSTTLRGRGTLVTLRATPGGEPLAEFIIGDAVPDRPGLRFVRVPGKNRTYAAEVDLDLSTRFADWIDTDLVDVTVADAERLSYDTSKVNPDRRTPDGAFMLEEGEPIVLTKRESEGGGADWSMNDQPEGMEVDDSKVGDVIRTVDTLRIVGVRPIPQSRDAILRSLFSKGFYLTRDGGLFSNEGGVSVGTDEGLVYTLRFGEVTFASGEALTAGSGEDDDPSAGADSSSDAADGPEADDSSADDQTESRYLYITARFDPELLPPLEDEAADPNRLPDDLFARDPDDPVRVAAEEEAAEEAERRRRDRERAIERGEEKVAELMEEFSRWYYVVPGDDFRKIALDRDAFLTTPGAEDEAAPAATPDFGPGGLPGGFSIPGINPPAG